MRLGLLGLACSLTLFGSTLGQNMAYQPDPGWHAPEDAASKPNPLVNRPAAASGGKKLFLRNCAECHGEDGGGILKKHSADLQLSIVQEQKDGALYWKITNGNPDRGLPSFSKLPELQRWQLVLHIRALKPQGARHD